MVPLSPPCADEHTVGPAPPTDLRFPGNAASNTMRVSSAISATIAPLDNHPSNTASGESYAATPPPIYDVRLECREVPLALIKMDFNRPEMYFDTTCPPALENRTSAVVYTTRMAMLNKALLTPEMQRSILFINRFKLITLVCAFALMTACFSLFVLVHNSAVVVLLFVAGSLLSLTPTTAKYVRKCEEIAGEWTREDEQRGVSLKYRVLKRRRRSSRIDVAIVVIGKAGAYGNMLEGEWLPEYQCGAGASEVLPPGSGPANLRRPSSSNSSANMSAFAGYGSPRQSAGSLPRSAAYAGAGGVGMLGSAASGGYGSLVSSAASSQSLSIPPRPGSAETWEGTDVSDFGSSCVLMAGPLTPTSGKRGPLALSSGPSFAAATTTGSVKHLLLACPTTTEDIRDLYETVFLRALPYHHKQQQRFDVPDDYEESRNEFRPFSNNLVPDILDNRVCLAFGYITKATVEKSPILIILDSSPRAVDSPTFININAVDYFVSEVELGHPGTFAIRMGKAELRFSATSSIEYQRWENAFIRAMDSVSSSKPNVGYRRNLANAPHPGLWSDMDSARSLNSADSQAQSNSSMFNPEKFKAVSRRSIHDFKNKVKLMFGNKSLRRESVESTNSSTMLSPQLGFYSPSQYTPPGFVGAQQAVTQPETSVPSSSTTITSYQQQRQLQQLPRHDFGSEQTKELPIVGNNFTQEVLSTLVRENGNLKNGPRSSTPKASDGYDSTESVSSSVDFRKKPVDKSGPSAGGRSAKSNSNVGQRGSSEFEMSPYFSFPSKSVGAA
ncbi:hypothetical protein HDU83_007754 [Entophlyctis luteolus]|nr:hypothetical protein HDU83_007754 [Entophlyctis luteolus]